MLPRMESILKVRSALIAFGGNQPSKSGAPEATLTETPAELANESISVSAISRFYRTPAFPAGSGPDFVNGAALLKTTLGAAELLAHLHDLEAEFGRLRQTRWAARTLDLDLIAIEDEVDRKSVV